MAHTFELPEPIFDPKDYGQSMDAIDAVLPLQAPYFSGMVSGDLTSRRIGDGFDIDGVRPYVPGDDVRHIDQAANARSTDDSIHIRERYDDVSPGVWIVTDSLGGRHRLNPGYFSEEQMAMSAVYAAMRMADASHMPYGLAVAADNSEIEYQLAVSSGPNFAFKAIEDMIEVSKAAEGNSDKLASREPGKLGRLLRTIGETGCSESVVVVVSDFREQVDPLDHENGWVEPLLDLANRGNNIVAIELTNPWDFSLPEHIDRAGTAPGKAVYLNRGKRGADLYNRYGSLARKQQQHIANNLAETGASHLTLRTEEPLWLTSLVEQLDNHNQYISA